MKDMSLPESSEEFQRALNAVADYLQSTGFPLAASRSIQDAVQRLALISDALGYVNSTIPYMAYYRHENGMVFACDVDLTEHIGLSNTTRISWQEYAAARASVLSSNRAKVQLNYDGPATSTRKMYNDFLLDFINNNL